MPKFLRAAAFYFLLLLCQQAQATALRLFINCVPATSPPPSSCAPVLAGQQTTVWVMALDGSGQIAADYTGTVNIMLWPSSISNLAHTFSSADQGRFAFTTSFLSPFRDPPGIGEVMSTLLSKAY